jgi:hypothetical protein
MHNTDKFFGRQKNMWGDMLAFLHRRPLARTTTKGVHTFEVLKKNRIYAYIIQPRD